MKWINSMLCDENGKPSSNRVLGAVCVVCGLVLLFMKRPKEGGQALTMAVALLGVGQVKSAIVSSKPSPAPSKGDH